ncbi:MAG: hypothetical protein DLM73_05555 [Chthoniobacterales bacterium]|nr:MAG: hypothetical protein DLM73_05555 [Chthoniobacterales bacterium]
MLHPMRAAQEIQQVASGLFIWQLYDPTVKADLFATGLATPAGIYLIDPVPLEPEALVELELRGKMAGIIVTNANHVRSTGDFSRRFALSIHAHQAVKEALDFPKIAALRDGEVFSSGLTAIAIEGGPAGEMALHYDADGGTMVVGDALINFEPYGFALLPAKYCSDSKLMHRSLEKLLAYPFERMLFAHGTPILSAARRRTEELLANS